jgi:hypothetical protein
MSYAGLQDYRSRTGESKVAMILSEKSPECDIETVCQSAGITENKAKEFQA